MEPGICYIKAEYLIQETETASNCNTDNDNNKRKAAVDGSHEAGTKKRRRGQNKKRPVFKADRTLHLCNSLLNGVADQCKLENCRYVHNLAEYLAAKGADLGDVCPVFDAKGFCPRGVTCRYGKSHIDALGRNMKSSSFKEDEPPTTVNGITTELQVRLRKREYNVQKTMELVEKYEKLRSNKNEIVEDRVADAKHIQPKIDFVNKLILAPLTTVGNLPFRRICKEFGADITVGEMACAVPLVKGLSQEWALTKRHITEHVFGVQLCGNNSRLITQAAQLLQENASVDFIDLNIGCPIDLIYRDGGGSALMRRTNVLETTVRSCAALSTMPITVKMRTGIYANKSTAHELLPLVEEWGAAAVTVHGRSREQRYTKNSNWEYIDACAAKAKQMPVIGNGDILSYEDFCEKRKLAPHVSAVMIGRGALIKPWIFKEIKDESPWNPTSAERFEILRKYCNYGLEHWGSDTMGVETTRRFLLEWQSFLYRYIPHELLLHPPQKINERPQKFRGRDEMETLMTSSNSMDWVKLSEMLLGPVPAGFEFVPKHKANAF